MRRHMSARSTRRGPQTGWRIMTCEAETSGHVGALDSSDEGSGATRPGWVIAGLQLADCGLRSASALCMRPQLRWPSLPTGAPAARPDPRPALREAG